MEEITSKKNPLFAAIRTVRGTRRERLSVGLCLAEGPKLVSEAVRWGAEIETIVYARGQEGLLPPPDGARAVVVPEELFRACSDVETPQGVLALCRRKDSALPAKLERGRYLVLDGVQDPGNVGTIWRTADALGADGIMLVGPCADPWSPKTMRATMGACFRLPIWETGWDELCPRLTAAGLRLYAAALRDDTADVRELNLSAAAVVIGSEGRGVSQACLARCDRTVKIPMRARCESLNAASAATVILWEMAGSGGGV